MTRRAIVTVGDRVRAKRLAKKLSQLELANLAKLRPETVNRIETGRSPASLVSLHKIAPVLDTTVDGLLADESAPPPKPAKTTKGKK